VRLEYPWKELWISVLGLLSFVSSRVEDLLTSGEIDQLAVDVSSLSWYIERILTGRRGYRSLH